MDIKIPKTIKIGGFDYTIEINPEQDRELQSNNNYGECAHDLRRIRFRSNLSEPQFAASFLHETLHAVDGIYCNYKLSEDENSQLSNGLFQVFEQLGIRFVR